MGQQFVNFLTLGSVFALFSLGLTLAWGALGVLNLGHGALMVLGGYVAFAVGERLDAPFIVLLVAGMAAAGAVAVLMEFAIFRPVRAKGERVEESMMLASIGAAIVIDRFVANATGDTVFSVGDRAFASTRIDLLGLSVTGLQIIIVVTAVAVGFLIDVSLRRSRFGRAVRSTATDPVTARLIGIPVNRIAISTMFVSGALAGMAGVLLSAYSSAQDVNVGAALLLKGFAVLIVGGVGSVRGTLLAAYLVAGAETIVVALGRGGLRDGVAFVLIVVVLLLRPQGLLGNQRLQRV